MPPEPSQTPTRANPPDAPPRYKFRVRFRKAGDLRLVSHHDLMHVFERMFRRADLHVPVTQGFNPRPKIWFALSLALGVAGVNEVLEFELTDNLPIAEVNARLVAQCPPGLQILSMREIDFRASAKVRRAIYALPIASGVALAPRVSERCEAFLQRTECWMKRSRPNPRRVNVCPFVSELQAHDDRLTMALWITPTGAARPEEIIDALGLKHLLDDGAVIERTDLEIMDELPEGTEGPPTIQSAMIEINADDVELPEVARPTAIISNPMSFET